MFKKLVTNLPFSPGLASQVSFYAKRLRQEEFVRRIGIIFITLTMTVQGFMVISPPLPAIAAGPNNILYSGVRSKNDLLNKYRKGSDGNGHNDIRQIFNHYKINEASIRNATQKTLYRNSHNGHLRSIGRYKKGFTSETKVHIRGTSTTIYERNLSEWHGGPYKVLEGKRTDGTFFAVILHCGNIVIDSGDKPKRPPTHHFKVSCDTITGKVADPDGGVVPIRAWIRVNNEPKTAGGWIDITGKIPYKIPKNLKSSNNKTRVSIEVKDVDTGVWIKSITGAEFGPCLPKPKPKPKSVASCSSLKWVETKDDNTTVVMKTVAHVENARVKSYSYNVTDSSGNTVFTKVIDSDKTTNTIDIKLKKPGTYKVSVGIWTSKGLVTSPSCIENVTIKKPIKPIAQCSSLKWIETKGNEVAVMKATAHVKNTRVNGYTYEVKDENGKVVFNKTVKSNKTTDTIEIKLEDPGKYSVSVSVLTKEGSVTSPECLEVVTIQDPVKPIFEVLRRKEVSNITQKISDANGTNAKPGDIIEYRLYTRNTGNVAGETVIGENLADILEYSKLVNADGGKLHEGTGELSWGKVKLQPNEENVRTIRVQVNSAIPATPRSAGDLGSYDLVMRNVYGDDVVTVNVPCSEAGKCVEKVVQSLPNTGPGTTALVNAILIAISVYFFVWNRQMGRELELVKKEYNYSI